MKKITWFVAVLLSFSLSAQNNSNDTTFVSSDKMELDYFGNFDAQMNFPDGSETYRKIIMTVELGQYDCDNPNDPCHEWDYDVQVQLLTANDSLEMGRFVTPYAGTGWSRFGSDWTQPYVYDVTDFYPLLKNQKTVRLRYAGYSGGFTAKIKFAFIEGVPAQPVVGIKKAFSVIHAYGDANDPFNDYLPTFSDTAPEGTVTSNLKVIVTGHGADQNNCCEFMSHSYDVNLNGTQIDQKDVWRTDCGLNDLYPQGGTWIYNRSNWCPGAKVEPFFHDLSSVSEGDNYDLDLQFEDYTGSGDLGNYKINGIVFYYGERNHQVDAGLTDIIAPTDDPNHFRANPSGSKPKISVQNNGTTPITSIDFSYGANGSNDGSYSWSGNLDPSEETTISLPEIDGLTNLSLEEADGQQSFHADITAVNGDVDDDPDNNTMTSNFEVAPQWPATVFVKMKTSNVGANGSIGGTPTDVSWTITDMNGEVIESRTNADSETQYNDEVTFSETGFYKLTLTSENCFGLHWWALDQSVPQYEPGNLKITDANGMNLPLSSYTYNGTEHDDWGCRYVQYFTADAEQAGVEDEKISSYKVYPIPAQTQLNVDFKKELSSPLEIKLVNIVGQTVYQSTQSGAHTQIPVNQLTDGVYFLQLENDNYRQIEKVIVGK